MDFIIFISTTYYYHYYQYHPSLQSHNINPKYSPTNLKKPTSKYITKKPKNHHQNKPQEFTRQKSTPKNHHDHHSMARRPLHSRVFTGVWLSEAESQDSSETEYLCHAGYSRLVAGWWCDFGRDG